jgi:hypothetical protein
MEDPTKGPQIVKVLDNIISNPSPIDELIKFINLLERFCPILGDYTFLPATFRNRAIDFDELNNVLEFTDKNKISCPELYSELEDQVSAHLSEEANEIEGQIELSEFFTISQGYDGDIDQTIDEEGLIEVFESSLEKSLSDLSYDVIGELNINIRDIAKELDFDSMVNNYIQNSYVPDDDRHSGSDYSTMGEDIDDLFERT